MSQFLTSMSQESILHQSRQPLAKILLLVNCIVSIGALDESIGLQVVEARRKMACGVNKSPLPVVIIYFYDCVVVVVMTTERIDPV